MKKLNSACHITSSHVIDLWSCKVCAVTFLKILLLFWSCWLKMEELEQKKKNATVSSFKDSRIFHEKEDLFHNTEFSDQKEQSPPALKSRWCVWILLLTPFRLINIFTVIVPWTYYIDEISESSTKIHPQKKTTAFKISILQWKLLIIKYIGLYSWQIFSVKLSNSKTVAVLSH